MTYNLSFHNFEIKCADNRIWIPFVYCQRWSPTINCTLVSDMQHSFKEYEGSQLKTNQVVSLHLWRNRGGGRGGGGGLGGGSNDDDDKIKRQWRDGGTFFHKFVN
jgi:hypothetical protein